jgi:ligand-binding sensor domain-containing protein/serine phosphatase RsbU (regulator of sigma subunit)
MKQRFKKHSFFPQQVVLLLVLVLLFTEQSFAQLLKTPSLSPDKHITQFSIDIWDTEQGLPSRALLYLEQTSDGYIWISSYQGIFRFDGINFEVFDTENTSGVLKTNAARDLFEREDGMLCISTSGDGLIGYKDGKFRQLAYLEADIETMLFDTPTHAWAGTKGYGIYELNDTTFRPYIKIAALNDVLVPHIIKDKEENVWFATEGNGLVKLDKNGKSTVFTTEDGLNTNKIRTIFQSNQGKIWIGTNAGLCFFEGNEIKIIEGVEGYPISRILEDYHGSIWMASDKGILRYNIKTKSVEVLAEKNGLPSKNVEDIVLDREGNIWFAMYRAGLGRIQEGKFSNYTTYSGLASKSINAIAQVGEGEFLVATGAGIINRIKDNKISIFAIKTNLLNSRLKHIHKTRSGAVLISTYSGLLVISPDGTEKFYTTENGLSGNQVRLTYEDHLGNIWIGTRAKGLIKMSPEGVFSYYNKGNGYLPSNFIMSINQDKENKLLVGTNNMGLNVVNIENDGFENINYNKKLTSNLIFNTYTDKENNIWIATNKGFSLLKDGIITQFTTKEGLSTGACFDILEDNNGYFWVSTGTGIMRILKQDLHDFAEGKIESLSSSVKVFTKSDGMISEECAGATFSLKTQEGNLMFPTLGGVTFIHPDNIFSNKIEPPVVIEKLIVDEQQINIYETVTIEPDKQRFTFHFTALSLVAPTSISLKYKLEGYDKEWTDSKGERHTVYTGLPYGKYTFKVKASNNDGLWNEEGAILEFEVKPHFHQTIPFYILSILLLGIFIYAVYRFRIRSIQNKNKELEALVLKRTQKINSQNEELLSQKDQIQEQNKNLEFAYNDISMLSEIGKKVTATLDANKLNRILYESINKLMKADGFGVGMFDKNTNCLNFKNYIENGQELSFLAERIDKEESLAIQCFTKQEVIFMQDQKLIATAYKNNTNEDRHGILPKALIYIPLVFENKAIGVITVQSFEANAYKKQDITILQTLGSYISIALANADSYTVIQDKNKLITDSIRYAERIQQAVLPSQKLISESFKEDFILFSPKDIVSGDFYWFNKVKNKSFIAVADCTGHGVPGAFMSMIGMASLNEIVNKEKIYSPAQILTTLHTTIRQSLKQEEAANDDGMDIALCLIEKQDEENVKVTFSGAKRPLYYSENEELKIIKGNRKSIGGAKKERVFTEEEIFLSKGEIIYLFSDGIIDQHAPNRRRFGTPLLEKTIRKVLTQPLKEQKEVIEEVLKNHQQDMPQRDDIAVVGIKV